ncbi:aminoglycoside phosphotransferase family protein [Arthrobacter tumbae]|uniref:aminoglycoside phosphotransferase family protein n=1 Tax=Arthrobacter tumbae TaxID=163874 RepID=UPI001959E7D5|nr:aminoglycoside phosphotransferase family protein [Arthrobacter tumbae]MBM7782640.1 aminoglycoside phosphotransferase (APT) family kinase protein [Arthrobacter tumbae]
MATMPAAEVDVTSALVMRLLADQHPDLAHLPLVEVAHGWDNVIFRLGDDLAVRLPRRQAAAELIRNEQHWLPELSPGLATVMPVPVRTGTPSSYFPWYWTITRWLDGTLAADVEPARRSAAATDLAQFVLAFHRAAPADAPQNRVRGVPLSTRSAAVEERIAAAGLSRELLDLWRILRDQPGWTGPPLWLHGDLHAANLVLNPQGRLAGVLDFGDLTSGDPATDLAAAWLVFNRTGRRTFIGTVTRERPVDAATWQRARGWALCIATAMAATSDDNPVFHTMGTRILDDVLTDDVLTDDVLTDEGHTG